MKSPEEFGQVFATGARPITPSDEQWVAITAPLEPSIIIAGAGTGKTTTMASRISYLIGTGQVLPEKILGLTFTKKAARELGQAVRLRRDQTLDYRKENFPQENPETAFGEPTISTYNSFGSRLLKEHGLRIGIEPDARVLVDATRYQLAARVVSRTKSTITGANFFGFTDVVEKVLKLDEECSNYLVEPQKVVDYDQEIVAKLAPFEKDLIEDAAKMLQSSRNRIELAKLVEEFRQAKLEAGIIDYSDQIRLSAKAALHSDEMCRLLREQYDVVLLDEYQDTSVAQKILLLRLFGDGHPVMAVGDPCQAIYGWRGADVTNIENFAEEFQRSDGSPAHQFSLSVNRRSGQNILDAANSLSAKLRVIHTNIDPLQAGDKKLPPGEIHSAVLMTAVDEAAWVGEQIAAQIKLGRKPGDIALLVRANKSAGLFVAKLEELNIPVQVADPGILVHLPEIRDILCYLELMVHPTANTALVRLLSGPRWRLGARDLAILGRHARHLAKSDYRADKELPMELQLERAVGSTDSADQVCLLDALEDAENSTFDYSDDARMRMQAVGEQLRRLRRFAGDTAIDAISRIVRESGLGAETYAKPEFLSKAHSNRVGSLLDLAGSYRSLDGESGIHAFLRFLADAERFDKLPEAELNLSDDAVVVMTVHKSKGLEFPVVAVPILSDKQFASTPRMKHWFANAELLPFKLKDQEVNDSRVTNLLRSEIPEKKQLQEYRDYFNEIYNLDERRLVYVAATRAQEILITSCSWWGPTQIKPWGPSEFHDTVREHATHRVDEGVQPEKGEKNPFLSTSDVLLWPAPINIEHQQQLQAAAQLVQQAETSVLPEPLSESEQEVVSEWDLEIEALTELLARMSAQTREVALPDTLTASQVVALHKDEESFVRALVRPMPRKPAPEAVRGTNFHAWVEDYYGKRALGNMVDDPPGSDSPIYDDAMLDSLKKAFTDGAFAHRNPYDLETPFALVVQGRPLIGRIDAVFAGTIDDPNAPQRWTVVDWKTGAPGSADPIQLHIYRAAWAENMNVPLESVDAVFYYVGHQVIEPVSTVMTVDEIAGLI